LLSGGGKYIGEDKIIVSSREGSGVDSQVEGYYIE